MMTWTGLLEPYHTNVTKRLVETPKLYLHDTGLCAYLTEWSSPETLGTGAMSDAILETWIMTEILKGYWHKVTVRHFTTIGQGSKGNRTSHRARGFGLSTGV